MCLIKNSNSRTSPGSESDTRSSTPDVFAWGSIEENLTHSTSSFLEEALPKQSKFRRENVFEDFLGDSSSRNGRECRKVVLAQTGHRSSLNSREPFNGRTVGCMLSWPMPASPVYLNHVVLLPKSNTINSSCKSQAHVQRDVLQCVQTETSTAWAAPVPFPNISQHRRQQSLYVVLSPGVKHLSLSDQPVSSDSFAFLQYNQKPGTQLCKVHQMRYKV